MGRLRLTCEVPTRMVVEFKGEEIKIYDRTNDGRIQVEYNKKNELVKFIKDLQRDGFPNCHFGHDNTINLYITAGRRTNAPCFCSNYIRIARLDCIIQVLNSITKDKIKIMFDKSLEDKSIGELLTIKRRVTNRKRYKTETNVKYIEV